MVRPRILLRSVCGPCFTLISLDTVLTSFAYPISVYLSSVSGSQCVTCLLVMSSWLSVLVVAVSPCPFFMVWVNSSIL